MKKQATGTEAVGYALAVLLLLSVGIAISTSGYDRQVTTTYHDTWREAKEAAQQCLRDNPDDVMASARTSGPYHGTFTSTCTKTWRKRP
jgi:hypothetical protein